MKFYGLYCYKPIYIHVDYALFRNTLDYIEMLRYFIRTLESPIPSGKNDDNAKSSREDFDLTNLEADPGKKVLISDYHPNIRNDAQRAYIFKDPC